jgi:hypothetical protein
MNTSFSGHQLSDQTWNRTSAHPRRRRRRTRRGKTIRRRRRGGGGRRRSGRIERRE